MRKGVLMAMMIGVTIQLGLAAIVGALILDHLFIYVWKVYMYYTSIGTLPTIWNSIWLLIKVSVLWAILTAKINLKE